MKKTDVNFFITVDLTFVNYNTAATYSKQFTLIIMYLVTQFPFCLIEIDCSNDTTIAERPY